MKNDLVNCNTCPFRQLAVYAPLSGDEEPRFQSTRRGTLAVNARDLVLRQGERPTELYTLLEGWAFRFQLLPDGRRQILSFLVPGDFIGDAALLNRPVHYSVQALTNARLCAFDAASLIELFEDNRTLMTSLARQYAQRAVCHDDLATDLGRRNARERIARFVLNLEARLKRRGMATGDSWPFPLHRQHLADALGMTSVHVSRSLSALRREQILEVGRQTISILDRAGLYEAASA